MHFICFGAGAVGGVVGARLFESGHNVTLIARGEHLNAIRKVGLQVHDATGSRTLRIPVRDEVTQQLLEHPDTFIVLAVKSQHTAQALATLRRAVPADTPIVSAQNGIANERKALRYFENVYGCQVSCPATHTEPGIVQAHLSPLLGRIDVGRYPAGVDEGAERISAALRAAGFDSVAQDDVMCWKRDKLITNLATAVEAICGPEAANSRLAELARAEGRAVLNTAGLPLPSAQMLADRGAMPAQPRLLRPGGSAWQSLRRRTGDIEADYINGEIVLLGRLHNVATPVNELIRRCATEMASEFAAPGSVPESELLARLELAIIPDFSLHGPMAPIAAQEPSTTPCSRRRRPR